MWLQDTSLYSSGGNCLSEYLTRSADLLGGMYDKEMKIIY